jgi:succinate dehydrogenase/fumarate reductase flavoprotein subunit
MAASRVPLRMETDVLVVGGGGAGLAAAAEAAAAGARVLLIEKNADLGGSTAWSVGSISATRTPQQKAAGISDDPDAHFADLEVLAGRYANRDNRALRRILVDEVTELMAWLESLGLVFVGPTPEPPHRVSRMHNVVPNSRAFPYALGRHCRNLGVDIRTGYRAESLSFDGGRCSGATLVRADGEHVQAIARRGVVLAAGDYSADPELRSRLAGPETAHLVPVNPTATGDGFRLGMDAGATVLNGDIIRGPILRFVPPRRDAFVRRLPPNRLLARGMKWAFGTLPDALLRPFAMAFLTTALGPSPELLANGAVYVDRTGARLSGDQPAIARAIAAEPDGQAFIVCDDALARRFSAWPHFISTAPGIAYAYFEDYRRNRSDLFHAAPTPEALARSMGARPDRLARTFAEAPHLTAPPFYALGPVKSYVVFTDGGLAVDTDHRVLDAAGHPIPALYAAGSNGQGGVLLEGHGHHLAWAFISGRRAGRRVAASSDREIEDRTT